jgi:hypothetical protein
LTYRFAVASSLMGLGYPCPASGVCDRIVTECGVKKTCGYGQPGPHNGELVYRFA